MQGYVTSEPYAVEKAAKIKPKIFLLADSGFNTYSTLIETRRDVVENRPGLGAALSSMPRRSAGTIISTATTKARTS